MLFFLPLFSPFCPLQPKDFLCHFFFLISSTQLSCERVLVRETRDLNLSLRMQSSRILISEIEQEETCGIMELQHHEIVVDLEFWPLQHPMQPDDEDRPVVCPMPHSSQLVDEGAMHNGKRTAESWRKRAEVSREVKAAETTVRAVRKRHHHTLSRPDHPTAGMSPLPPLPTAQSFTIFQMLQQLDGQI